MKVFIDPGHGGRDSGAVGNGLQEKALVLTISRHIRSMLLNEYENVEVRMSREDDRFIELGERARLANAWRADCFISVHINAGGGAGFESFVHPSRAARTVQLQQTIHPKIVSEIQVVDRGMKTANFSVLRNTSMPAILTENLFIDNTADAAKLKDNDFLRAIARGHVEGIVSAFNLRRKQGGNQVNEPSPTHQKNWEKATAKGIFNGERPKEPLTREQLATILNRLGLLD